MTSPTLADVAQLAGVSVATASRALANTGEPYQVSPGRLQRVQSAADTLGYRPLRKRPTTEPRRGTAAAAWAERDHAVRQLRNAHALLLHRAAAADRAAEHVPPDNPLAPRIAANYRGLAATLRRIASQMTKPAPTTQAASEEIENDEQPG